MFEKVRGNLRQCEEVIRRFEKRDKLRGSWKFKEVLRRFEKLEKVRGGWTKLEEVLRRFAKLE